MKRIVHALLPTPVLSIALLVLWLLLNRSMSAGHILLGTLLASDAERAANIEVLR